MTALRSRNYIISQGYPVRKWGMVTQIILLVLSFLHKHGNANH